MESNRVKMGVGTTFTVRLPLLRKSGQTEKNRIVG